MLKFLTDLNNCKVNKILWNFLKVILTLVHVIVIVIIPTQNTGFSFNFLKLNWISLDFQKCWKVWVIKSSHILFVNRDILNVTLLKYINFTLLQQIWHVHSKFAKVLHKRSSHENICLWFKFDSCFPSICGFNRRKVI